MSAVEPSADIRQAAMSAFQIYRGFVSAGFTEAQALTIVAGMFKPQTDGSP